MASHRFLSLCHAQEVPLLSKPSFTGRYSDSSVLALELLILVYRPLLLLFLGLCPFCVPPPFFFLFFFSIQHLYYPESIQNVLLPFWSVFPGVHSWVFCPCLQLSLDYWLKILEIVLSLTLCSREYFGKQDSLPINPFKYLTNLALKSEHSPVLGGVLSTP